MTELKPTLEQLEDPYVLQLIEALCQRDDRIEELEAQKAAWKGTARAYLHDLGHYDSEIERLTAEYNWMKSELRTNAKIIGEQQEEIGRKDKVIEAAREFIVSGCDMDFQDEIMYALEEHDKGKDDD